MSTFKITAVNAVASKAGSWSGGSGLRTDAALIAGANVAHGSSDPKCVCGDFLGDDPSPVGTDQRITFEISLTDAVISLNGGAAVSFGSLPAGFQPTSANINFYLNGTTSVGSRIYFASGTDEGLVVSDALPVGWNAYSHALSTIPSALLLVLQGASMRATLTGATDFAALEEFSITGNYTIVSNVWYYNPSTNHYEYTSSVPSAPWVVASPTPGNPTPAITSVKRITHYDHGVGDTGFLVAPAYGCAGTTLYILGSGFGDSPAVTVGGINATNIAVIDSTLITCDTPTHADGAVDVVVFNADGLTSTLTNGFTYQTPWWVKTILFLTDDGPITQYVYVQQCSAPSDDIYDITTVPPYVATPDGWYVSSAEYAGTVWVTTGGTPADPRTWGKISVWAAGNRGAFGGSPGAGVVIDNRLIYPSNSYTVGTDYPPIRIFDGYFDHELCRLPPTTTDTIPNAVISMIAANGTVYLTTHGSGTSSADWVGRVFELNRLSGVLTPLGAPFTAGELPYTLCWFAGRLWCGTSNGIGTAGKVYSFRPGVDTAWAQDYDLTTSSVGGATSMCVYNGKLYVGTENAATFRGKVLARDTSGAYTTSDTGSGGTAKINNAYLSMCVFGANLYASYWNNDTTAISLIRKFDGSTWSTVYTGSSGTLRPFVSLLVDDGLLFALGGGMTLTAAVVNTANGTSWTDRTANLPDAVRSLVPIAGTLVL